MTVTGKDGGIRMNIILVDDHPLVRKGLKALLEEEPAYRVVGQAGTGAEAISVIANLQPEVAILDIKLPDMSGFQVATAAKRKSPGTRIIMLSMHADEFHVSEAFRSGADGYIIKNAMENEVVEAIRAVTGGSRYVSRMLSASGAPVELDAGYADDPYQRLTRREREILRLIAQGSQNKKIAERLFISCRTVETHRASIMRKLNLRTHAELIHFAIQRSIIDVT